MIVGRMFLTDLERPLQQGFLTDIRGIVRMLLQEMNYVVGEEGESFITDAFVDQVIVYLEKTRFFQKLIFLLLSSQSYCNRWNTLCGEESLP